MLQIDPTIVDHWPVGWISWNYLQMMSVPDRAQRSGSNNHHLRGSRMPLARHPNAPSLRRNSPAARRPARLKRYWCKPLLGEGGRRTRHHGKKPVVTKCRKILEPSIGTAGRGSGRFCEAELAGLQRETKIEKSICRPNELRFTFRPLP